METTVICSEPSFIAAVASLRALYDEHRYITIPKPRIGRDRSLDQNSLFHKWLRDFAAHVFEIPKKQVSEGDLSGTKRAIKAAFYNETHEPWMIHKMRNPLTGEERIDYTSSASLKTGELHMLLNWFQLMAAERGLVLEALGQFERLQRGANK